MPGLGVPGLAVPGFSAGLKVGGILLGSFGLIDNLFMSQDGINSVNINSINNGKCRYLAHPHDILAISTPRVIM